MDSSHGHADLGNQRRRIMEAVKSRYTKSEMIVGRLPHGLRFGCRFRRKDSSGDPNARLAARCDRNETDRRRIVQLLAGGRSSARIGGIGQHDPTPSSSLTIRPSALEFWDEAVP